MSKHNMRYRQLSSCLRGEAGTHIGRGEGWGRQAIGMGVAIGSICMPLAELTTISANASNLRF